MTDLLASLAAPIAGAVAALGDGAAADVALERPADAEHGDYATSVAMRLARQLKRPPRQIAEEIGQRIQGDDIAGIEVAGPGFLNLRMSPAWFRRSLARILAAGEAYGRGAPERPLAVNVEFVSANPTGVLTIGSARNGAYGDSLARLFAFQGHHVTREYLMNDAGVQVQLLGASLRAARRGEPTPEGGYAGDDVREVAALLPLPDDAPAEDWVRPGVDAMMDRVRASLERMRVHMDVWFSEAGSHGKGAVDAAIARAAAAGHVYEQDGATWLATSRFGDDKDRVLVKADGEKTYFAGDLAYLDDKLGRGFEHLVYVLGADHHGYIGRLKAAAACLGHDPKRMDVVIYQLITVSGERMGKRRGNVITLDELVEAIGVDAARWFLVQRSHEQPLDIDTDLATERSSKNPVYYAQYAHARASRLIRLAAEEDGVAPADPARCDYAPERQETDLIKRLIEWPAVAREALELRSPHRIVAYVHTLAGEYHVFQHDLSVRQAESADARGFRLALAEATRRTIATALDLVGVEAPDQM